MSRYLLDTNILLRAVDPASTDYNTAVNAIAHLLTQTYECCITAQVLIEFWVVATRPTAVNGLGWSIEQTQLEIEQLLDQFPFLDDTPQIFTTWLQLVNQYAVKGKRTHDIRLLAVMMTHAITNLLTFNPSDFIAVPGIAIVHPQDIIP